jgi:hypothetical protein
MIARDAAQVPELPHFGGGRAVGRGFAIQNGRQRLQ